MLTVTPSSCLITGDSHFLILCLGSHVHSVEYWPCPEFITDQIKYLAKKEKKKHLLWENNINALAHLLVSIATITNDLKSLGFKQHKCKMQTKQIITSPPPHKCFILQFWSQKLEISLTGIKSMPQRGCVPFGGSGENSFSCLFQDLEAACTTWPMGPSSLFETSSAASSNLAFSLPLYLPPFPPSSLLFRHYISFSDSDFPASLLQGPL